MKKIVTLLLLIVLIAGCMPTKQTEYTKDFTQPGQPTVTSPNVETNEEAKEQLTNWRNVEFKDVLTGNTHKVSDFAGKPVLIESFAVWCPTCTRQQKEIKKLHDLDVEFIGIGLDTDPNEAESQVINHATNNGFDWIFSVSPIDLTKGLIEEFTISVITAPQAPIVLVCPNGDSKFLERGIKTAQELKDHIEGC